jgi:hypothetical protein
MLDQYTAKFEDKISQAIVDGVSVSRAELIKSGLFDSDKKVLIIATSTKVDLTLKNSPRPQFQMGKIHLWIKVILKKIAVKLWIKIIGPDGLVLEDSVQYFYWKDSKANNVNLSIPRPKA